MNASVLAHHPAFHIGAVEVRPATKTLRRDGLETVVEPRVMQVLVALAEAHGDVVSRDDLVERCWDGRIVGDDAVNRIMSRLRRLAEGVGQGSFMIETVTKVGYRLRPVDTLSTPDPSSQTDLPARAALGLDRLGNDRRALLGVGAAGAAALIGSGWWWSRRAAPAPVTPEAKAMLDQALLAFNQDTREGQSQAGGILRQLVADQPDYADAWGALGMTYAAISHFRSTDQALILHQRARAAGRRALALDPDNGLGTVAIAGARSYPGNWLAVEAPLRALLRRDPHDAPALYAMSQVLLAVGRLDESLAAISEITKSASPSPGRLYALTRALWYAGRPDETDLALARATALYPTHFALWFSRYYIALYSGRPDAALSLAADRALRPSGIPEDEIASVMRVAQARLTPSAGAIDAVIDEQVARARTGAGYAENAAQFATVLGRPAVALEILRAYYFGDGFVVPELRWTPIQGTFTPRDDRLTGFLFAPSLAPLRGLRDFEALLDRLGLEAYWRRARVVPDYRRARG